MRNSPPRGRPLMTNSPPLERQLLKNSSPYRDSVFLELYSRFQSPGFRIPKGKVPSFRNPDSLTLLGSISAVSRVRSLILPEKRGMSAGSFSRTAAGNRAYYITWFQIERGWYESVYYGINNTSPI